ncbi:MAG: hypothetical protein AB8G99_07260 [Planctomycetaceae bacterium]
MGAILRFGKSSADDLPTELEFRKSVGTSGLKKHVIRSSKYLMAIYPALRAARSRPNDLKAMRKLRKACAGWVTKKGAGGFMPTDKSATQVAIEDLGKAADGRYCTLVHRFYNDQGRQEKLEGRKFAAGIRDKVDIGIDRRTGNAREEAVGLTLSDEYSLERHTKKHISPHAASEKDWNAYKRKYPTSRLGFEDWVELIRVPYLEDNMNVIFGDMKGGAEALRKGVHYLSEDERAKYRVLGVGGRLAYSTQRQTTGTAPLPPSVVHTATFNDVSSRRGFGIFVITFDHDFYIGNPVGARFHHSSFMSGAPVYSAGEIMVLNGNVRVVTNKTGHYRAGTDALYRSLRLLQSMGVSLQNALVSDRSGMDSSFKSAIIALRNHCDFTRPELRNAPSQMPPTC